MIWRLTATEPLVAEWGYVLHRPSCPTVNGERRPDALLTWIEDGDGWLTDDPYAEVCGHCCPDGDEGVLDVEAAPWAMGKFAELRSASASG